MAGVAQRATDVRARARQGLIGEWATVSRLNDSKTMLNEDPQAVQVSTVTASGFTGPTKTVTINGVDIVFVAETSTTVTMANFAAAVNAEPLVRGQVQATAAVAVATLTGTEGTEGTDFTVTETDAELTVALVTAAGTADAVQFARVVISQGFQATESGELGALAKSTQFTPQVQTTNIAYVAGAIITTRVYLVTGDRRDLLAEASETSATDQDTTLTALIGQLNTLLPADSVLVADPGSGDAVFTAELAGLEFEVETFADDSGASIPAITEVATTGPSTATSLQLAIAGMSMHSFDASATIGGTDGEYAANAGMVIAVNGELWIENSQGISPGDDLFVELDGTGSDAGKLFNTDTATRAKLSPAAIKWVRDGIVSADGIAVVRLGL